MHNRHYLLLVLSLILSSTAVIEAKAQLLPDNTLGKENSVVNSVNSLQKQIDGGAIRGSNLFHSFKEFNIDSGRSVYFSNPNSIQNILTRVTGKNPSSIFGKLGVLGNANLFLINPNGIIFGKDASLDISGSFTATTSPSIWFDNGFEFSATNPQEVPLLKINLTPGLQYPRNQQADIANKANLAVDKDLNLIGKNLDLTGQLNAGRDLKLQASNTLQIRDSQTSPFIADAGNNLLLQADKTINIFALNHPSSGLFSGNDLILQSENPVLGDARYFSGGSFTIEQLDGNYGDLSSPKNPIIRASGDVSFDSYSGASLHILAGGSVNITGDVTITGTDADNGLQQTVTLSDGENLQIDGKNQATLDIRAGTTGFGTPGITGSGSEVVNLNSRGSSNTSDIVIGGNIKVDIADGLVFLTNQYNRDTSLNGGDIRVEGDIDTSSISGNGGRVFINAFGDISTLSLDSSYSPSLLERSNGNGGAITLYAGGDISTSNLNSSSFALEGNGGAITLYAGGNISTSNLNSFICCSFSTGDGGAITLYAGGDISTSNLNSYSLFNGNGGTITFNAGDDISTSNLDSTAWGGNGGAILLESNNSITVNSIITSSDKKSGDIQLQTKTELLRLTNSFISTNAENNGNGGNIYLQALSIELTQTDITSTAPGSGFSGNISLESDNLIYLDNSRLLTALEPGSIGEGGNIEIKAKKLQLENFSLIDTGTYSTGNAGNVNMSVQDISLNNNSSILSLTTGGGNAGNINLQVADMASLTNQSKIATAATASSTGNSGDINIISNSLSLLSGSQLLALTQGTGSSGNITLNVADTVDINGIGSDGSLSGIFTSSEGINSTKGGDITIVTSNLNITDGGVLSAQTFSQSDGGNITVNAHTVSLQNGGQMLTNTFGAGRAGKIIVNATGNLNITGADSKFENRPTPNTSGEQRVAVNNSFCGFSGECKLPEQEPNNSIETAQRIAEEDFSIQSPGISNFNVEFSTRIPYVSVGASGDNSVDYYAIEIKKTGTRAVFDLDYFAGDFSPELDTKMTLFDNQGNKFVSNDNSSDKLGAGGSDSNVGGLDPYIRYTFTQPGTYFIKVDQVDGSGIPNNVDYELQISLEAPSIATSTINSGAVSGIFAGTEGNGSAGNLEIKTPQLYIGDRAQVTVSSKGNSRAGNLSVDTNIVNIENQAKMSAENESGSGGNIIFNNLESLKLNQNSQISASTENGEAGDITINATDSIQLNAGSTLESEAIGKGNAGELNITTKQFAITDNSKATVSSKGNGNGGNLLINANDINLSQNATISATTESGISGDITLDSLNNLSLNNSEISASTINGKAGNLNINVTNSVELTGKGGLSVQSTEGGIAGSVKVNTTQFDIKDDAQVTVSSPKGQAGNLDITADNLFLTQGKLTAETGIITSSEGANITLDIQDLLWIQDNSLISAEAFDTANGGNITINNPQGFVIGLKFENSDITANANQGNGGNIDIITQNIFGLEFRSTRTDNSDITASSQFGVNGKVTINQLNVNPSSGLVELPSTLVSTTEIKAGCAASRGNKFVVSGKGGLPQSPEDIFSTDTIYIDLVDLVPTQKAPSNISNDSSNFDNQNNKIVEATGWITDTDGKVIFVAKMPENNSQNPVFSSVDCEKFSE
ncbi:MAG: filamentous hemagglutinin N-terminal domain-containing protein [Cyanobacteria bacterium J06635_10]